MGKSNGFFKKGDICELKEWTRLILMNESTLQEIENGEMGPESEKQFITGRPAYEAIIYIARRIVAALQSKIATWEKLLASMPEDLPEKNLQRQAIDGARGLARLNDPTLAR